MNDGHKNGNGRRVRAAIVGSYPKPRSIYPRPAHELLVDAGTFYDLEAVIGASRFRDRLDRAVLAAIRDQEEAGLDFISDGEQRRDHYIWYIMRHLDGIDFGRLEEKAIRGGKFRRRVPTIVSRIAERGPFLVDDFRFLQAHARSGATAKVNLPGPITVADTVADAHYRGDMAALAMDYAAAIRPEVARLVEAGCRAVQFDDPVLMRYPEQAAEWGVEALERCFRGLGQEVTWFVHVCRGYPDKRNEEQGLDYKADPAAYAPILERLGRSALDIISIEAARGLLDLSVLQAAGDKTIMLGLLDVGSERVESVTELIERGRQVLELLSPQRLILAPDCGMFLLSRDSARQKLIHLAQAASALS